MIKKNKYFEVIFFLCIFIISLFLNLAVQKYQFPNTDTNQNDLFSNLLIEQGLFRYNNELNQKYNPPIFGIRGLLNFGDGFVPSSIPGMIIILALFKFIYSKIIFLINPLFVFIGLYYFYRIIDKFIFKGQSYSLITTALFFFSGAFLYVSSATFKDSVATSLFFVGLYYFLNAIHEKKRSDFLLFGFFAGVTIWLNYPSIIFYFPVVIFYLFNIKKDFFKKEIFKNLAVCSTLFLVVFFPLFVYQVKLFNGFLNFNNPLFQLNHFEAFSKKTGVLDFILAIDFHQLFTNFYNQIFLVNPLLVSFSILALIFIFLNYKKERSVNKILIIFSAIILMQFLFFLGKKWSGVFFEGSVGTSYARYLLVSWGLLTVLSVYTIKKLIDKKIILSVLIIFFIFSGLNKGLYSDMTIKYFIDTSKRANNIKEAIVLKTPENSIFFTSFYDKYIYPVRQTAVYVAIPKDERIDKTLMLMKNLLEDGYSVYIVDEGNKYAISPTQDRKIFEKERLSVQYAFGGNIYKIEQK